VGDSAMSLFSGRAQIVGTKIAMTLTHGRTSAGDEEGKKCDKKGVTIRKGVTYRGTPRLLGKLGGGNFGGRDKKVGTS